MKKKQILSIIKKFGIPYRVLAEHMPESCQKSDLKNWQQGKGRIDDEAVSSGLNQYYRDLGDNLNLNEY